MIADQRRLVGRPGAARAGTASGVSGQVPPQESGIEPGAPRCWPGRRPGGPCWRPPSWPGLLPVHQGSGGDWVSAAILGMDQLEKAMDLHPYPGGQILAMIEGRQVQQVLRAVQAPAPLPVLDGGRAESHDRPHPWVGGYPHHQLRRAGQSAMKPHAPQSGPGSGTGSAARSITSASRSSSRAPSPARSPPGLIRHRSACRLRGSA